MIYSLLWLLVAGYSFKSLMFGLPAVAFALLVHRAYSLYLNTIKLKAFLRLLGVFLKESFISGVDVTRRVIAPKMSIEPGFVEYDFTSEKTSFDSERLRRIESLGKKTFS